MQDEQQPDFVGLSAEIVSAYVAKNHIQTSEISQLIASVHDALRNVAKPAPEPEKHKPPVPITKTIRPDYIISLEDGRRYKSLKRHLSSRGLTPEQYRKKRGLRPDYPMVASSYTKARSELAKAIGLGQKRSGRKRAAKRGVSRGGVYLRGSEVARPRAFHCAVAGGRLGGGHRRIPGRVW